MKKCPNLSLKDGNPHLHTPPPLHRKGRRPLFLLYFPQDEPPEYHFPWRFFWSPHMMFSGSKVCPPELHIITGPSFIGPRPRRASSLTIFFSSSSFTSSKSFFFFFETCWQTRRYGRLRCWSGEVELKVAYSIARCEVFLKWLRLSTVNFGWSRRGTTSSTTRNGKSSHANAQHTCVVFYSSVALGDIQINIDTWLVSALFKSFIMFVSLRFYLKTFFLDGHCT